jgi:4-hydroxybenzoate polyprenyltransferase
MPRQKGALVHMFSFLKTIYLFPRNDVPTMIIPVTCLGTCAALSVQTTLTTPGLDGLWWWETLCRVPKTFFWVWMNVLLFSISNQRSEDAMVEDAINKPWRPLPAGRISPSQARRLLLVGIPLVVSLCYLHLGATQETIVCLLLTWMYNDLGGADEHFLVRNGVNSAAYFVYGCGAMRVASDLSLNDALQAGVVQWLGIVSAIILSTMHVQDLKDQEGDRARARSTAPLALGDSMARWTITGGVLTWSILAPVYWFSSVPVPAFSCGYGLIAATIPCLFAVLVSFRVLLWRDPRSDTITYKYWSIWLMSLFALPLLPLAI